MSAFVLSGAHAAGLGKLTVLSALGQPLVAEIELTSVSREEAGTLVPKLASPEAFQQANIDLHPSLLNLRFAIEQRGGKQYIRVTSGQPMNEPFVDMLLELQAANGRLVREYTFLLDPPELRTAQTPEVAAPIVLPPAQTARREPEAQTQPVTPPVASQPVQQPMPQAEPAQPAAQPQPQAQPMPQAQQQPMPQPAAQAPARPAPQPQPSRSTAPRPEVEVKAGDTLTGIAMGNKPDGVSLDQMLVALYRSNRDAFSGNNMNRLRAGRILTVPSAQEIDAVSAPEATHEVRVQAADFNEYRNKLAGQVGAAEAKPAEEGKQAASGKITATVKDKAAPAADAKDKLKLSKGLGAEGADKGKAGGVEDKIAKDKAAAEEAARIKQLEKNNAEMQKLLEMKNKAMADKQKHAESAKASASASASASAAASASASASASEPPKKPAPAPMPVSVAQEGLLDNPLVMLGGAAVVALLGGLGLMGYRRRKAKQDEAKHDEPMIAPDIGALMEPEDAEEAAPAMTKVAPAPKEDAPAAPSGVVDPIAEADVYIAYGRDEQAESILKDALAKDQDNHPVRAKLLEIYAARKDALSYEAQARDLFNRTDGEGEVWAKAAAAGLELDPGNPLYGGFAAAAAPAAPAADNTMDFTSPADDLGMDLDATAPAAAPAAEAVVEEAPAKSGFDDLDFDLEGLSGDQPLMSKPAAAPAAAAAPLDDPLANLEFSMEQAAPAAEAAPAEAAPAAVEAVKPLLDDNALDFDFLNEAPAPAAEAAPAEAAPAAAAGDPLDLMEADFANLASVSIDKALPEGLPSLEVSAEEPEAPAVKAEEAPAAMDFDLSDITLDLNPQESRAAEPAAAVEAAPAAAIEEDPLAALDLSLDLPPVEAEPAAAPAVAATAAAAAADLSDFKFDTSVADADQGLAKAEAAQEAAEAAVEEEEADYSENAEMATKLDLAIAYEEIGDKEGARELLEEVVEGGNTEQVKRAKTLLEQLV